MTARSGEPALASEITDTQRLLRRGVGRGRKRQTEERKLALGRQLILQVICLLIAVTVLFPIVWILSMAIDPRTFSAPTG